MGIRHPHLTPTVIPDHWPDIVNRCQALTWYVPGGAAINYAASKTTVCTLSKDGRVVPPPGAVIGTEKPPSKRGKRRQAAKRAARRKRA